MKEEPLLYRALLKYTKPIEMYTYYSEHEQEEEPDVKKSYNHSKRDGRAQLGQDQGQLLQAGLLVNDKAHQKSLLKTTDW